MKTYRNVARRLFPNTADRASSRRKGTARSRRSILRTEALEPRELLVAGIPGTNLSVGDNLITYRIAIATTGEFTQAVGGKAAASAKINETVGLLNELYGRELAVNFALIPNNDVLIFENPATDPYTKTENRDLTGENQTAIDQAIGAANYDIGHLFGFGRIDGQAGFGAGQDGKKAVGITNISMGEGSPFSILKHEMGHQFTALHTFNAPDCSGTPVTPGTAYEPGGGSTIMSYGTACGANSVGMPEGNYFHAASFHQIVDYIRTTIPNVGTKTPTGNTIPTVNAGLDRVIPRGTPFSLSATANDPDAGDNLQYTWEQVDLGVAQGVPIQNDATGPLFVSLPPTNNPARAFPRLEDLLANTASSKLEHLPTQARDLNFRVTVRDNHRITMNGQQKVVSGVKSDDMKITVVNTPGPFAVASPNTAVTWNGGSTQTITWNVNGTNQAPINTANVKISMSTDGGNTFQYVIAASTPNDGTHPLVVPNITSNQARIKVEAIGNIYFDISDVNYTINRNPTAAGISSDPTGADTRVEEGGATDTYQLRLNTNPTGNVTVSVAADAQTEVSLDGTNFANQQSVTFNNTAPRTITVRAVNDTIDEGLHNGRITHTITTSVDGNYPVGTLIDPLLANILDDELPPLVGVEFDAFDQTTKIWPLIQFLNGNLTDVRRDDGVPTPIDFRISATGGGATRSTLNAATVPRHTPSLAALDSSSNTSSVSTATWSSLTPSSRYEVYVFAGDYETNSVINQTVTVTGLGTDNPAPFVQNSTNKDFFLLVNDQDGSSNRPLKSYAKIVTSDATGRITVNVAPNVANGRIYLAGMAIRAVDGTIPAPPPALANDAFAAATPITGATATVQGNSDTATKEAGEPAHAGGTGGKSVWWNWTAPAAGNVTISTAGSAFDTVLAVYTGANVTALTQVASNDDLSDDVRQSQVTFPATAGTTYRIAVDGYTATASGAVTLAVNQQATNQPTNTLGEGKTLAAGESIRSNNGNFQLTMQTDGNLVLYNQQTGAALWFTNTSGRTGVTASMQTDGNLVLYQNGTAIWHAGTFGNPGAVLSLADNGSLILRRPDGVVLWVSGTGTDTVRPDTTLTAGQQIDSSNGVYRLAMQGDGNLVLYNQQTRQATWHTSTMGRPGATVIMQVDGNLVAYHNGAAVWQAGTVGNPGAFLVVQDDGNLVVRAVDSRVLWESRTAPPPAVPPEDLDPLPTERIVGDSNGDGRFDSRDLVQVFQLGKYETGLDTTFAEGDWNNDGVFDSSDLVAVMQAGHYQRDSIDAVFAGA